MATENETLKIYREEFEPLGGRLQARFSPREGWLTVGLVLFLVLSVVWSVEIAGWVDSMPPLTPMAVVGVFAGMLLAKVKRRSLLLHPIGLALGYLLLIWQTRDMTVDGNLFAKTDDLISRFQIWFTAAESGGISADPLPFVTIMLMVVWSISYFSSWFVFRSMRLWPVLIPTAVPLFLNLLYLPDKFNFFFYIYILAALLLAMRIYFLKRRAQWQEQEIPYFRNAASSFALIALILGSVVIFTAWALPRADFAPDVLRRNWAVLSIPWKSMEAELGRVLAFLPGKTPYTIHKFGGAFPFRGPGTLGGHVAMTVRSDKGYYLRAETFEVYTHEGWLTGDRTSLTDEFLPENNTITYRASQLVDQSVDLGISTDAIFATGIPLFSTVGFEVEIAPPMTFDINLDGAGEEGLPEDLVSVAKAIRAELQRGSLTFTDTGALRDMPEDTVIKEIVRKGNKAVKVVLSRLPPNPPDITALRPNNDLKPFDSYDAISYVSLASEEALRLAGTDYPSWVTDRYLQLPADMPARVGGLGRGLARTADNPYDMAVAIRNWLRKIPFYSTDVERLPQNIDGVDYFLFETKRGYSSYFASAMTVMLRSAGIPARLVVGYSTGDWDEEQQAYVVPSSKAHPWPEAYFPEYGWIPFEPTPPKGVLPRGNYIGVEGPPLPLEIVQLFQGGDPPGQGDAGGEVSSSGFFGSMPLWVSVPLVAVPVSLLLIIVLFRFWLGYGLSGMDYRSQVYGRLSRLGSLGGYGPSSNHTPMEYTLALAIEMDAVEGHLERLGEAYAVSRYSPWPLSRQERLDIEEAWGSLRRPMLWWAIRHRLAFWRRGR
ncbi:MAG: transglutaminase domain-containing protein [Chloroflexi bacterium]|nr:transglutaminase domain-containing protein [Chloroflexota bacterium]